MATVIYLGDFGAVIEVTVKTGGQVVSLANAKTKTFRFRSPTGKVYERPAQYTTDGYDGKLRYTVEKGFLNERGVWRALTITETTTARYTSTPVEITVKPPFGG